MTWVNTDLNEQEQAKLPFQFKAGYWSRDTDDPEDPPVVYATWRDELVWSLQLTGSPWFLAKGSEELTENHYKLVYNHIDDPRLTLTKNTNTSLEALFKEKKIRWSESNHRWQYFNHVPVDFSLDEEQESEEVSALLETTIQTATRTLATLTPEQPKKSLPGELPETPVKLPTQPSQPPPAPTKTLTGGPRPNPSKGKAPAFTTPVQPPQPSVVMASTSKPAATTAASTKVLGSAPEPFDGSTTKADAFWTALDNYYYLNQDLYPSEDKRIASALTHFKIGSPAGEWAKDKQDAALTASPVNFGTWNKFRSDFKAHFIPVESVMNSTNLMHTFKMGNRPFADWYQEWSTHASRSGANETTKMYAFRNNIPVALNNKLCGVSPAPTTMTRLVELTKEFDTVWRTYNSAQPQQRRRTNIRATDTENPDNPSIALADFPPSQSQPRKFKKLSQDERDKRRREGRCLYCGKQGHWADKCLEKQNRPRFPNNRTRNNPPRTRATEVEPEQTDQPSPEPSTSISQIYAAPDHLFDLSHPDPDYENQDF
jgi:hypothetical protein